MAKQVVNPPNLFPSLQHGFSQAVLSSGSRLLFVSGQTGWDATKQLVGGADLAGQVRQAFQNLATAVRAAGADLGDVMTLRDLFCRSSQARHSSHRAALKEWFPTDPPASSWLGVTSLARPEFLVEVEAIAVLDVAPLSSAAQQAAAPDGRW